MLSEAEKLVNKDFDNKRFTGRRTQFGKSMDRIIHKKIAEGKKLQIWRYIGKIKWIISSALWTELSYSKDIVNKSFRRFDRGGSL